MSIAFNEIESRDRKDQLRELTASIKLHGWTWSTVGAIAGLGGGILAAFVGSVMTGITWITGATEASGLSLHRWGTLLLLLTIPLLVFGAHCLDLQGSASKRDSKRKEIQNS